MKTIVYLAVITSCVLSGCSSKNEEMTFVSLPDDAVIVKVNDNVLRKRDLLNYVALETRYASKHLKGNEKKESQQRIHDDFINFIPTYIEQRLLVDDAKKHAVLTEEEVNRQVNKMIDAAAKLRNLNREEFLEKFKDEESFMRESAATRIWISAHVASNIPPVVVTTPQIATNYVKMIEEDFAAVKSTNEAIRARLDGIRADCLAGKSVFTNIAAEISVEDWDLGEKERMEFDTASMRDAVFALKEGMISPVLESETDYFLLYVDKIIPAEKNKEGKTVHPERRRVYQMALLKEDYPLRLTYEQAFQDLAYQFQMQAVKTYVDNLKTNGLNTIEWPYGKNLFNRASK